MVVRRYERRSGGLFNALGESDAKSVGVRGRVWHRRRGGKRLTYSTELLVGIVTPFPSTGVKEVGVWWMQALGAALFVETLRRHGRHTCEQRVVRPARLQ